jgi:uncharacterized membrane protein
MKMNFIRIITILSFILLLINILLVLFYYPQLPDVIDSHFNIIGTADNNASKIIILILPILSLLSYLLFAYVIRHPEIMNFPVRLNETNKNRLIVISVQMINTLRFLLSFLFLYISISVIYSEIKLLHHINVYIIYIVIVSIFLTLIIGIRKMYSIK